MINIQSHMIWSLVLTIGLLHATPPSGEVIDQANRLAPPHRRIPSSGLEKTLNHYLGSNVPTPQTLFRMANGCFFSTAGDYAKSAQMILHGGDSVGKRDLTRESASIYS